MCDFDIRGEVNVQSFHFTADTKNEDGTFSQVRLPLECYQLLIGGRVVPTVAFERIPEEPLAGEPLGHVNLWFGKHANLRHEDGWRQLVWCKDGEARRTIVGKEPPVGIDPSVWKQSYQKFTELPQLFIGE